MSCTLIKRMWKFLDLNIFERFCILFIKTNSTNLSSSAFISGSLFSGINTYQWPPKSLSLAKYLASSRTEFALSEMSQYLSRSYEEKERTRRWNHTSMTSSAAHAKLVKCPLPVEERCRVFDKEQGWNMSMRPGLLQGRIGAAHSKAAQLLPAIGAF
jgi:hypothetical protein